MNTGDLSALERYWAEDMVWRGGSLGEYHGLAEFKKFAEANAAGASSRTSSPCSCNSASPACPPPPPPDTATRTGSRDDNRRAPP
ncbi:nuclear transport factor 2 family protein [Streptomyces sp. NBC_01264]|nr:nuclear transport factor 2 family protein [Streptomyces sp. NBC_01264]